MPTGNQYRIYDSKADSWGAPINTANDETLRRDVKILLEGGNQPYAACPEDFSVFHVASFADDKAPIEPCEPRHVFIMAELRPNPPAMGIPLRVADTLEDAHFAKEAN